MSQHDAMPRAESMHDHPLDAVIETALDQTDVIPELVSWWNGSAGALTVRIEVHIGVYAQGTLRASATVEDARDLLERLAAELDER